MRNRNNRILASLYAAALIPVGFALPAYAQSGPVLLRDSFPIGDGGGILCQVQDRSVENPAKRSMFDRAWAVVCRDSAQPVSQIYAFRSLSGDPVQAIAGQRRQEIDCSAQTTAANPGVFGGSRTVCKVSGTSLDWSIITLVRGDTTYIAEGFAAYDSASHLALESILDNRIAAGTIDAASTSVADPLSFARVQAETLKPEQALAEGYRRNLGGEYAEASAYFETLQQRLAGEEEINPGEFLVNRALQKSNLGEFGEANRLFAQAEEQTAANPVTSRLQRNFEAIHLLNQGFHAEAIDRLDRALDGGALGAAQMDGRLAITLPLSARINQGGSGGPLLGFVDELKLTPEERAEIIDAQALQLRGTALRLIGETEEARSSFLAAYGRAIAVRDGRVVSITRLRSQVLGELAAVEESRGEFGAAETYLRNGLAILEVQYPERRAVSGAQARLASFLLRRGRESEALDLYKTVIDRAVGKRDAVTGFVNQLAPYYTLLADRVAGDPSAAEDFFKATQVLVRPGVAETQAILARELSAKSDDGARLFRQAISLDRDIERTRIRYQTLLRAERNAAVEQELAELSQQVDALEQQQLLTQAALSDYPQYRVVSPRSTELSEFRDILEEGEAYARLAIVGGDVFLFYADKQTAKSSKLDLTEQDLDFYVDMLRGSISIFEAGQYVTYPYEVGLAYELYGKIFGSVSAELEGIDHLIFEPDGAMLRLPVDILVTDAASVAAYGQRSARTDGDVFDFTGVNWLARDRRVSTAVSAQAFVDARKVERSSASREYLGMGENVPIGNNPSPAIRAVLAGGSDNCGWDAAVWNAPIDDTELVTARSIVGEGQSELMTGADFTDARIREKDDLDDFRVLHFATHGLVTPPSPTCPSKPSLLTSFGGSDSDGLLSFEEIFALNLDADIIILSACDTAGEASIEATRSAGVATGGGTALDGLVRSFIGAGGRAVMASHWPAPDDYDATERLMSEMFRAGRSNSIGQALRQSQAALMDSPDTSHPYYWGGFAIIGDAARPLLSDQLAAADEAAGDPDTMVGQ